MADKINMANKPSQPINWPKSNTNTQLQQVKAAGISGKPNTQNPVAPAGVSPTTQGQPKNLSNIQVTKTSINDTQYQLTVSFDRDPTDSYYTETHIHMQQGTNTPIQVGSGVASPIKLIVNKSPLPTTVYVQATGNWGSVPVTSSPVKTISLANISPAPATSTGSGTSSGGTGGGSGSGGSYAPNQIQASPASGGVGPLTVRGQVVADQPTTTVNFAANDTNVTGTISAQTLTLGWTGTLAAGRLNANVVQAITNDTNVTGTIAAQNLTLGWTGTLAAGRLNANVVQAITNDTNITGTIAAQNLTLAWAGTLAAGRLNSNVVQSVVNDTNVTGTISAQALTLGWTGTLAKGRTLGTTVYTDQNNTFGNFVQIFQTGANFVLGDPVDTTKTAKFDLSNIATATQRTVNIPNVNSTTVQASSAAAHQFATAVSAQGVVTWTQPAASDLSNGLTGTGLVVLQTSPSLVTPVIDIATGTSVNVTKNIITGLNAMGNVTGATNVDLSLGNVVSMTLTGAATLSWINGTASRGTEFTFIVTQDGTGGRVITWPAQVAGITPILNLKVSGVSVFKGVYDGTNMNWISAANCYPVNVQTPAADTVNAPNNTTTSFATSDSLPPNLLTTGRIVQVDFDLVFTSSGAASPTMKFEVLLGGTAAINFTTGQQATACTNRPTRLSVFFIGTATPGGAVNVLTISSAAPGSNSSAWTPFNADASRTNGAISLATNGSLTIQPQFQASVNTAGNSLQLVSMVVRVLA